jgi:hypothetical protein
VLVGVRERGGHRRDGGHHLAGTQPAATGQQRGQAAAGEQVQDQGDPRLRAPAGLVHHVDQPDEVRVVELAQEGRLARLPFGVAGDQDLDRHRRPT